MQTNESKADKLFLQAEQMAHEFSLFPVRRDASKKVIGLLSNTDIQKTLRELSTLNVDDYIARTVLPSEDKSRLDAKKVIKRLKGQILLQGDHGPLYWCEMIMEAEPGQDPRRIGVLAQNRSESNGVWMPEHHALAVKAIRGFAQRKIPIVTFIDTPGADAGAEANAQNQAHSISRLIAEMAQLDVPTIGIILGYGYSGGAIPLATVNILLSVRDGVFNTIQPPGLASIARKYDLSWQECAKYVGVSAYELFDQGYIDGVIDYVPGERQKLENLKTSILSSIELIERNAEEFVARTPLVLEHYKRSMERYLAPEPDLVQIQESAELSLAESPTTHVNVFGLAYRYLRYLGLRRRIRSISMDSYGRLSDLEIPKGDLKKRAEDARVKAFESWLGQPFELRYDDKLLKAWKNYQSRKRSSEDHPGRFRRLVFGSPQDQFSTARSRLTLEYVFFLYNLWKKEAPGNLLSLINYLRENTEAPSDKTDGDLTVLDVMRQPELREAFIEECENALLFDDGYNFLIEHLSAIALEAHESNTISEESISKLVSDSLDASTQALVKRLGTPDEDVKKAQLRLRRQFRSFGERFIAYGGNGDQLKALESWKKTAYPRLSETLFAVVTFFCEHLMPRYYRSHFDGKPYDGRILPKNIGIKDFWNRLAIAYRDLLIQDLLTHQKRTQRVTPAMITDRFFSDFREQNRRQMSADPVRFPGFRLSIEDALSKDITPCGLITGIGNLKSDSGATQVGVAISNLAFQAGAFDMASAEKFCNLMCECMLRRIPIVCFISSGGMQTKEGAGALFSMPIVNDRLTRFVRDQNLPVISFGFGDCTGGAQASFVTHPLVQSYYLSGTNMPFAGQIVVPSYLPSTSTLSNYLLETEGAMQGLVKHPFWNTLDDELTKIDPRMPMPTESVDEVITRVLQGRFEREEATTDEADRYVDETAMNISPVNRVLIHARGCAAAKLVSKCQEHGIQVVLVQSDADSDSAVAEMVGEHDTLVCIGGNTADESYLNATSIIRIAEQERVDAIHPGIGFLSENADFAALCAAHRINFIGPSVRSMELMGNKSNAIKTARKLNVPVVPGSDGVVTTVQAARKVASEIGYPVLIKAVHGGGGKGIRVVESADAFNEAFKEIRIEAKSAFGNSDVYLERYVTSMRHVEVQVLRDRHGNTRILGLRDCSVQRNNQKIIEESGSTMLPPELEQSVYKFAEAIADEINYFGAGTVEFIYDLTHDTVYFMEMNTRLQVEHPVTEGVTGIDIVRAQFDIASNRSIEAIKAEPSGYCIEVRVNAEKVIRDEQGNVTLRPSPGMLTDCDFPTEDGVDILRAVGPNKVVTPFYDNMIAQVIVRGTDRNDTIERMIKYLERVNIEGVAVNIPMVVAVLKDEVFRKGIYDTTYLPQFFTRTDIDALIVATAESEASSKQALDADAIKIEGTGELKVVAPSTGVFYITPSPSDPDMVTVGSSIKTNSPICLMEAMKLFTTLSLDDFNSEDKILYPNDRKYKVVRIVATTGQVVNAGELMFVVAPEEAK
ncbi:MAG: acetyl/propionyl-CoA carboxylase alpha subunit/acetyl-CoA carboxylase beta subunit [Candidatus Promineifilaceae bacterium]|jgi:acetyl/propionyl-CoA carboxylase alpha subunit/acetyl-CoA carboxylase beta subunit